MAIEIAVERLERPRAFAGLEVRATEESLFDEAPRLARACAEVKEGIPNRVMPVVTAVASGAPDADGAFSYFMGDEVDPARARLAESLASAPGLVARELPQGTLVARVPVRFAVQATVPMKAARIRAYVYNEWMGEQGYAPADLEGIRDLELYHYRRRRFRQARKMVMELVFPIVKA